MIRAIAVRILRQVLLVVVGAEVSFCTEIAQLCRRGHATGRLSVDVAVEPPVDQISVRSEQWSNGAMEQCPSLTRSDGCQRPLCRRTSLLFHSLRSASPGTR